MAFEDEEIQQEPIRQNINDTDNSSTGSTDNNNTNNSGENNGPPPEVNDRGELVSIQTKSILVGDTGHYSPRSHEELDALVSDGLIKEKHKQLFVSKYEAWHGELPKSKTSAPQVDPSMEQERDQPIDINKVLPELTSPAPLEEERGPTIDLNAFINEENVSQDTSRQDVSQGNSNIPKALKEKIEQESGVSLDDVIIHYNSLEPFKFNANAITIKNEIFLAPGQEHCLEEELRHVVQQKQGLVKPTGTENGVPVNTSSSLETAAKNGQSQKGETTQNSQQQEIVQKNDETLTFVVKVEGKLTGRELIILIENQIYGQIVNSDWSINGVDIDPAKTFGKEGEIIAYDVTIPAAGYQYYRAKSATAKGVELDDKGQVKGADRRSAELETLPKGTKDALLDEINRRFKEASGKDQKEKGDEALWNVYRDEVLAQREKVVNLSDKAKQLVKVVEEGGLVIAPKDYPKMIQLLEKIEQMDSTLVAEYASRTTTKATSIEHMEQSLDSFVKEQEKRGEHKKDRTAMENELFATEGLFDDLQTFGMISGSLAPGSGLAVIKYYEDLNEKVKKYGFKNLADYSNKIDAYLASFQQEAVVTGVGLLQQYEHFLYEEEQRYLASADARALGDAVAQTDAKKKYKESDQNGSMANVADMATVGVDSKAVEKNIQSYRDKSKRLKSEADSTMQAFGKDHPLLKDPAFDLKKLSQQSPEDTKAFLLSYIKEQKEKIAQTKEKMQSDEDFVFTLDNLMQHMYQQEGIAKGSIQDKAIQDRIGDIKFKDALISIGIALLAIGLGLVSAGGGTVGVMAGVGGAALSVYDVTREFSKYAEGQAAHDVGLLSKEPSFAWVILAMVGAGLDFAAVAKLLPPLKVPVEDFNRLVEEDPVKALSELDKGLSDIGVIDAKLKANILKRAENKAEFLKKMRSMNMAQMQIIPGSKELIDLAVYAAKNGYTRVADFFNVLKKNGLKKNLGDLTAEETKALREALEEGVRKADVENLATTKGATLTDEQTQLLTEIKREIPADQFKVLESKKLTKEGLENYAEALRLAGDDTIARSEIIEYLRLITDKGTLSIKQMEQALEGLNTFMQKYQGKISGDFASRFRRAVQKNDMLEAQAEIKLAEDLLEGRTVLGNNVKVEGLKDGVEEGVQTPEYRMITASGEKALAEVKAMATLSKNGFKNNLKKAISQVKEQMNSTGEAYGYIRIDATLQQKATTLTQDDIFNIVKGRLLDPTQRGIDYIKHVEVLYFDSTGAQKLLFEVNSKKEIIIL